MAVGPCDVRARVTGPAVEATAGFVDPADRPRALGVLRRAHGPRFRLG